MTAADDSITILSQHQRPDDITNWLPVPASGPFNLTIRMKAPKPPSSTA